MLSVKDQLKAISWKCEETGLSYGKLVSQYSPQELNQIYREYEEMLAAKEKNRLRREKERSSTNDRNTTK